MWYFALSAAVSFAMKNEVLDILILGLLVVLFASIHRKRATLRLRCWVLAWVLVLAHFTALLLPVRQTLVDSLSLSTLLLLSGVCFLLSASAVLETPLGRALAAFSASASPGCSTSTT